MESTEAAGAVSLLPLEQLLIPDGKECPAQRREHRQFVVGPFDGGERGANALHLFAIVEGLAPDEHMRDAPRLESLQVALRHVFAETEKASKQDADVLGRDLDGHVARPLRHRPPALVEHPVDEGADSIRQRLLYRDRRYV